MTWFAPNNTNEAMIRQSIAETFAADGSTSGSTGIVGLTGKAQPVVRWGDRGMALRPIVTYYVDSSRFKEGVEGRMELGATFDVFVEGESTGLEEQIADRVEALMTFSNLNSTARTYPVDVAPTLTNRAPAAELDEGRRRLRLQFDLVWNR